MVELIIIEVAYPKLVALGITKKGSLVLFLFGEMDIFEPVAVIKGKVFEEIAKKKGVVITLALFLQVLRPVNVFLAIAAMLYLLQKDIQLFIHCPLIISYGFAANIYPSFYKNLE